MKKILIVLDNFDDDWGSKISANGNQYYLLTFGFSPKQAFSNCKSPSHDLEKRVNAIDSKTISACAEKEARDFYLDLIRDFPRKVSDILAFNGRNLWWYLNASEKSIWTGKIIHRLYAFLRFCHTCDEKNYDEIFFFVRDDLLRESVVNYSKSKKIQYSSFKAKKIFLNLEKNTIAFLIMYFFRAIRIWLRMFLKLLALRFLGLKTVKDIPAGSFGIFSIYPIWWNRSVAGKSSECFFGSVPDGLSKKEKVIYILWLTDSWFMLLMNGKRLKSFFMDRTALVLEKFITISDLFILFDYNILMKFIRLIKFSDKLDCELKGVNVSGFFCDELTRSLINPMFFQWILLDRSIGRIDLANLKALLFRLEFQPLEKALLYNAQDNVKSFGFQHSAIGKNFLNYVFTNNELVVSLVNKSDINSMPLPDYIFTCGRRGVENLLFAGYPKDRLAVAGGVRFHKLFDYSRKKPAQHELREKYHLPSDRKIIFVAASQLLNETICMLEDLIETITSRNEPYHVIIKSNPNKDKNKQYLAGIIKPLEKANGRVSHEIFREDMQLYDFITLADYVLLTGGSVAFESMVLGVVPLVYDCEPQFSHNPMIEYPQAVLIVNNSESIGNAFEIINDPRVLDGIKTYWEKPLSDMFSDVLHDPTDDFLELLEERVAGNVSK
ncbi:hypothetical protein HZC34_07945 [Candidatus Saganbacteria bacterium]|nr:hypothetical protein [Candidatus Saganbacteria bacterium]